MHMSFGKYERQEKRIEDMTALEYTAVCCCLLNVQFVPLLSSVKASSTCNM